ncbi:NUDIX domain-containing protein [Rossellomorea vietnamensis]|uniref:NUDIX domain-containing protein n=1 Tax=Rossellomorea vietnamensis TaxID=218284 RepID=A0A5D4MK91_9BACI|nr:NUDIX domain-containing protein [Rossellomorea vietnamensis]TYS01406.1 NUDIX domain-containing protein [Rossellomorea vietnamensis]
MIVVRNRGAVVIIEDGMALLIKRVKNDEEYYVFPGGGVETGETPEEAAIREAKEELGVTVELKSCLTVIDYYGKQFYFLAEIQSGVAGSGMAAEFQDPLRGSYEPVWVAIKEFHSMDIRPLKAAQKIQSLFLDKF